MPDAEPEQTDLSGGELVEMTPEIQAHLEEVASEARRRFGTVTERYPEIQLDRDLGVELVEGTSHMFIHYGELIFRFCGEDVDHNLAAEVEALAKLRSELPVSIPDYKYVRLDGDPELRFVGYPMLVGTKRLQFTPFERNTRSLRLARRLGEVLAALHSADTRHAVAAGMEVFAAKSSRDEARRHRDALMDWARGLHPTVAKTVKDFFLSTMREEMFDFKPTFVHGNALARTYVDDDLLPQFMLGWSSLRISDPAIDLAMTMFMVGPAVAQDVYDGYVARGGPVGIWPRALLRWGILNLEVARQNDEKVGYAFLDVLRTHFPRLTAYQPGRPAGRQSILTKLGRLGRS